MALNGTLKDMGLVALLQFLNAGRRSGRVTIESEGDIARFYYDSGKLVHAEIGELSGEEVLVQVVDWTDGSFRFEPGVESEEKTIEKELHRTIMWALKERDERKKEQAESDGDPGLAQRLAGLLEASERFRYASVISFEGEILASTPAPDEDGEALKRAERSVAALIKRYGDPGPSKMLLEDGRFSLVLGPLVGKRFLMAVAPPETRMGMLPLALSRLTEGLSRED
jgi:hypothetical protein